MDRNPDIHRETKREERLGKDGQQTDRDKTKTKEEDDDNNKYSPEGKATSNSAQTCSKYTRTYALILILSGSKEKNCI